MEPLQNLPIPVVALDNDFPRLSCNTISINNQMGAFQAIEYLIKMGHTRIGYLKSRMRASSFEERQQGYESALLHFGGRFSASDILEVHDTEEGCSRDMKQYLETASGSGLPRAFVCDDDTIAAGAVRAFSEYGCKVPEDFSVIGFNDRPLCEITTPPLTSVNVPKQAMAAEAVDELIRLIQSKEHTNSEMRSRKIRIGTKLVIRQSVADKNSIKK